MFDFSRPAYHGRNLVYGGVQCQAAHILQPDTPFTPLQTSIGEMPVLYRILYVERGNSAIICWKAGGRLVVAFSGLAFENDGLGFLQGAADPIQFNRLPGKVNRFSAAWANRCRTAFMDGITNDITDIWLYGHSMGSTQAHLLGWEAKQFRSNLRITVVTYGSPKFCDFDAARSLMVNQSYRVMATGDSMTYVMPTVAQAPFFCAFFDPISLWNFTRQVHMPNGFLIDSNGSWQETDTPAGLTLPIDLNVTQFVQNMLRNDSPHNMTEMVRRLNLAFPEGAPAGATGSNLKNDLPESQRPPRFTLEQAQQQSATVQQWLDNRAPLPPWTRDNRSRITIRREGKRPVVKLDGTIFYVATSQKDAKAVALATRSMLRQYVQQPGRFMNAANLFDIFAGKVAAPGNPDKTL